MTYYLKNLLKKIVVSACIASLLTTHLIASVAPIEYDIAKRSAIVRSELTDDLLTELKKNIDTGSIELIENHSEVSLPLRLASKLTHLVNHAKGVVALYVNEAIDTVMSLSHIYNEGQMRIKSAYNLNLDIQTFISTGELNLIDDREIDKDVKTLPLEWELSFSRLENAGAILGDVFLSIQGLNTKIDELGGLIAARNISIADVVDLKAFIYSGYGITNLETSPGHGDFVYNYTTGAARQGKDPTSVTFDAEANKPVVRGAIFAKNKAQFNYTHKITDAQYNEEFSPLIAAYLNVSGAEMRIDSDIHTKLLFTREDEKPLYDEASLATIKILLPTTTMSTLSQMWPTLIFQTRAASDIGKAGLEFEFTNSSGNVTVDGAHTLNGSLKIRNADTFFITENTKLSYGNDSSINATQLVVNGHFYPITGADETQSFLEISALIRVGLTGEFTADNLIFTPVSKVKKVHLNLGKFQVNRLTQKQTNFYLENHGQANIKHVIGQDYTLHLVNNSQLVSTSSPVFLRYEQSYLEKLVQVNKNKSAADSTRIEGFVETDHAKGVQIEVDNRTTRPVDWHQTIVAKKGQIHLNTTQPLTLKSDSILLAEKSIKLGIPGLTVERDAQLQSGKTLHVLKKERNKHILDGYLTGQLIWIDGENVSGSGTLDAPAVVFKTNHLDTEYFRWKHLNYLNIQFDKNLRLAGGNKKITLKNGEVKKSFVLDDRFVISGKGLASIESAIQAKQGLTINLSGNSQQTTDINSENLSSSDGAVHLIGPNMKFNPKIYQTINGSKGIYIQSNSKEIHIGSNVTLAALAAFVEIHHLKHIHYSAPITSDQLRLVSGGGLYAHPDPKKTNIKKLELVAPNGLTDANSIRVKELVIKSRALTPYNIEAEISRIEADFASLKDICFNSPDAISEIGYLRANNTQLIGTHHFSGGTHEVRDLDISQSDVTFNATKTHIQGELQGKKVDFTSPYLTLENKLKADTVTLPEHGEHLTVSDIITAQKTFLAQSKHLHLKGKISSNDGTPFDVFALSGLDGFISGEVNADSLAIVFKNSLALSKIDVTAKQAFVQASTVKANGFSLTAEDAIISSKTDMDLAGNTFKGGVFVITTAAEAFDAKTVDEAFKKSHQAEAYEGNIDLTGSTFNTKNVSIFAGDAKLTPGLIKSDTVHIGQQTFEGGLKGALSLAHELYRCENVTIDARRIPETWVIDGQKVIRRNVTMEVRDTKFLPGSLLKGSGLLRINNVKNLTADLSTIESQIVILTAESGNIDLNRSRVLTEKGEGTLEAKEGSINVLGTTAQVNTIKAGEVTIETLVDRTGNQLNFADHKVVSEVETSLILNIEASRNITFKGAYTKAGQGTIFRAGGHILDFAVDLVTQIYSTNPDGYSLYKHTHASVSEHTTDGDFTSVAMDMQHLFAPKIKAKKVYIYGANGISCYEVHDRTEAESHTKSNDGPLGGKSEEHHQSASAISKGINIDAEHVTCESIKAIEITNAHIKASKTILKSAEEAVKLLMGTNYFMSSTVTKESNAMWQGQGYRNEQHNTFSQNYFSGEVEIDAKKGALIQAVHEKTIDYLNRIKMVNGKISYEFLEEVHKLEEDYKEGPTAAFAAVIAIAASIATTGAGGSLAGAMVEAGMITAGGTAATAVTVLGGAAISSLTAQASVAFVTNKLDIIKAAENLAKTSTLKNIGIAVAAAGLMGGADSSQISGLGNHALYQANKMLSNMGASALFGEGTNINTAALNAAVSAVTAYGANSTSDLFQEQNLPQAGVFETLTQTALGTASGFALGGNGDAAFAGGIGAAAGSIAAKIDGNREAARVKNSGRSNISQYAQMAAIMGTMGLGISEHHGIAAQMAGISFDAVGGAQHRLTEEAVKAQKQALEEKRAREKAEAEVAEKKRLEEESRAKTDKQKEQARVKKEKAEANQQKKSSQQPRAAQKSSNSSSLFSLIDDINEFGDAFDQTYNYMNVSEESPQKISFSKSSNQNHSLHLDTSDTNINNELSFLKHLEETTGVFRCDSPTYGRNAAGRKAEREALAHNKNIDQWVNSASEDYKKRNDITNASQFYRDPTACYHDAYLKTQSELGLAACQKRRQGHPLSEYENTVRQDFRGENTRYWKQMGGYGVGFGLGLGAACTLPVNLPLAVILALSGGALDATAGMDYKVDTKIDAALVAGSAIINAATLFLPGSGQEVSFLIRKGSQNMVQHGLENIAAQRTTKGLDLAQPKVMRPAANLNNPVIPTANLNRSSVAQNLAQTEVNSLDQLARNVAGGGNTSAGAGINHGLSNQSTTRFAETMSSSRSTGNGAASHNLGSGTNNPTAAPLTVNGSASGLRPNVATQVSSSASSAIPGSNNKFTDFTRPLQPEDLGTLNKTSQLTELKGTFSIHEKIATARVDMIKGENLNTFSILGNFKKIALSHGAETLKIEGTIANPDLLRVLSKRFEVITEGANEYFIFNLTK